MVLLKGFCIAWIGVGFYLAPRAFAEVLVFDSPEKWQTWQIPTGVVLVGEEGQLELKRFQKDINAIADAHLFKQPTQQRGEVTGGIWQVGSNSALAPRILDGDAQTFWAFEQSDDLVDWVVTIDLGRPVLAERIRLHFPDQDGARPWRQFSVFVATGARIQVTEDIFKYEQVFRTTKPNGETLIEIEMVGKQDTARVIDEGLDIDLEEFNDFRMVRFLRIRADEKSADAALAEVEVIAAGDNVSLGVLERGGSFDNGLLAREPQNMFDGITDTYGNIFTVKSKGGWRESGVWWEVDLGALFWLDEAFIYWQDRGEGLSSFLFGGLQAGTGYEVLFSDGRRTIAGNIDYTPLIFEPRPIGNEGSLRHHRYRFAPRRARYLFWHSLTDTGWFSRPMEFMLFSPGYPAQVTLQSGFIDLGRLIGDDRPKAIKTVNWQAEIPTATRLQLRSRSGNELQEAYIFHDRKGEVITQNKWAASPNVLKGPVDTLIIAGNDWGEWSNFYQFSGEDFKSDTPRRFIQLELILSTDDPQVAPVVNSLTINFEDALVREARGRILPRETGVNEDTHFTYTVQPSADARDSGFDRLRLDISAPIDLGAVRVQVGEDEVFPSEVRAQGDTLLFIDLPQIISSDSVRISFATRVLRNATVFNMSLGLTERPGLWQSVEALERRSNTVFLPDLVGSGQLVGDLRITPATFTPNGDGINDEVQITFALLKAIGAQPQVRISDLAGRHVAELSGNQQGDIKTFIWDGRSSSGEQVGPGIYLCQIDAGAEVRERLIVRTVAVAY